MAYRVRPIEPERLKTYPLRSRPSKVTPAEFGRPTRSGDSVRRLLGNLPDLLAARDLRGLVARMGEARRKKRAILWGLGAHVIKTGLAPILLGTIGRRAGDLP